MHMVRTLRKEGLNQRTFGQNGALNYYWTKLFLQSNSNNLLSISIFPCWNLHGNKKSKHIFNYALSVSGNVLCIGSNLDSHPCLNPSLFSALSWKSGSFFLNIVFEAGWVFCTSQLPISVVFFSVFHQSCCSQSDGMLCRSTSTADWIPTSLANSWFLDESTKDFAANKLVTPSGVWWLPP